MRPKRLDAFADERRAAIDHAAVELHQRRAGIELRGGVGTTRDSTNAHQRHGIAEAFVHAAQHRGRLLEHGLAGKATRLAGKPVFEVEYKSSSFNCTKSNGWNFNAILKTVDLFDTPWTPCR